MAVMVIVPLDGLLFALTATYFLLLVQEKVSKENDTLPRCLTLRSVFWNGGQELAA
jgi:hypothetical protein